MAMGKILARLIPDDPLIPLLNRDAQPTAVVATRNSSALSNIVVPTKPRGNGKLNNEPSSSKHSEELMRKNVDLERQLWDVQKSIDELKSPRSHQQTLDLDSAPLNLSITAEPYQEGFKIPHLETYDGSGDPDEHLHTYQAIMRIQNANDAMMCKVFPATLKSKARRWYHKLLRHSIDSYYQLTKLFSNKFASQREIKRTVTELMQVHQREGESLKDYMQRFNKATLDIDNVPDTICLSVLLHGLKRGQFLDDLLENPPKTWNEVNDKSQILAQIQHWIRRPSPPLHDSPRVDKSKHCDYHRTYGHNTEDCQHLKDELEFLARNGKLEGYVQKPYTQKPSQTHFVQGYDRPNGQRYQLGGTQDVNGVGYAGIPSTSGTINMISGGIHSGGQSARGRKAYARQVMTVNKNRPLKRPFEEAEWENAPITFSPVDYKRAEGELDVMMPHGDPFVATVHIGNHNVNKVFIDTGSSPDILYWSCFQKMQLNSSSLQKYEGPIYGFDNQPIPVEGVITLPIYVGSEPCFRIALVSFLVVKMESAFNAILGRATLCELKAVISQPHLCFENHRPTQLGQQTMSISDVEHRPEGVEQKAEPVEPMERSAERCLSFFKALREPKNFQWTNECQRAFDELKQYLVSAPLLSKPVEGESLYVYLGVTEEAVSSVLLREENKNQKPICYVSKILQGAKQNYPLVEKAAFALKLELSGWLIGWSVELSKYDLKFQPRTTIKGQTMADFLAECILTTAEEKAPEHPVWVLYVDGAANVEGLGSGAVLVGPGGFKSEHALRFKFQTTNNAVEYEALIYGLKLASELKVQSIQVFSDSQLVVGQVKGSCEIKDPQLGRYASVVNRFKSRFASFQIDKIPRADNQRADELSKLASS
ncbi:hypothetical protein SLEP1_g12559 [Rubroshorea leprosula]|nr:hypothetical protein SLEP1_g12559 [Rubroshorea leprosula]